MNRKDYEESLEERSDSRTWKRGYKADGPTFPCIIARSEIVRVEDATYYTDSKFGTVYRVIDGRPWAQQMSLNDCGWWIK
jgi:hypothetical protein